MDQSDALVILHDLDTASAQLRDVLTKQQATIQAIVQEMGIQKEREGEMKSEIIKLNALVQKQQATIGDFEKNKATEAAEASRQKTASEEQNKIIDGLHSQIGELTRQLKKRESEKLSVDGQDFSKFKAGTLNEGLYVSKSCRHLEIEGKDYEDKTVLCEYKKLSIGKVTEDTIRIGDLPFKRVLGGTGEKVSYIQEVGPQSFFEFEGKHYIRWFIRSEHEASL